VLAESLLNELMSDLEGLFLGAVITSPGKESVKNYNYADYHETYAQKRALRGGFTLIGERVAQAGEGFLRAGGGTKGSHGGGSQSGIPGGRGSGGSPSTLHVIIQKFLQLIGEFLTTLIAILAIFSERAGQDGIQFWGEIRIDAQKAGRRVGGNFEKKVKLRKFVSIVSWPACEHFKKYQSQRIDI
jgi:hypothetical protein